MEAKAYKRINYKSDFILTLNSDAGWMTPFCIKFWTGAPSQAFFVGWDGTTYTHCSYDPSEPTKLLVQFDDHHLPIGDLKFQIAYHFTVADFPNDVEDEVLNKSNIVTEIDGNAYQVMLDLNGETAPEIQFSLPAYANEAQRIANEQQRITNEEQRIADEQTRIDNEALRISAEQTRQNNEDQRIRNEQTRISQEEARVREFATLKHESEAATTAANDAAALANQKAQLAADKAQLAADKAALAQDAANLANQKAQLAADKAALANDAAALANEKAALAQQKAEYAKDQGDYAKQQGDYAKEQGDYAKRKGDDAAAQMQQQAQAFSEAQAARQTAYEQSEGTESGSVAGDGSRWGAFKTNEAARDAKVDAKVADITNLQEAVAEGAVYDISANNSGATYANLTAALGTDGANVPVDKRKGGMSVKFVQSSDNTYVQYRLMSDTWSTAVADWQGVDEKPASGSNNLVKSSGVANAIGKPTIYKEQSWTDVHGGSVIGTLVMKAGHTYTATLSGSTGYYKICSGTASSTGTIYMNLNLLNGVTSVTKTYTAEEDITANIVIEGPWASLYTLDLEVLESNNNLLWTDEQNLTDEEKEQVYTNLGITEIVNTLNEKIDQEVANPMGLLEAELVEAELNLAAGGIWAGNNNSEKNLRCNNYIEVKSGTTIEIFHADDITVRISEYGANKNFLKQTGYSAIESLVLSDNTKYVRISADGYTTNRSIANPAVSDFQEGDFGFKYYEAKVIENINKQLVAPIDLYPESPFWVDGSTWKSANATYGAIAIPVTGGKELICTANDTIATRIAFANTYNPATIVHGTSIDGLGNQPVAIGTTKRFAIPDTCTYVILNCRYGGNSLPVSLIIDGTEYMKPIDKIANEAYYHSGDNKKNIDYIDNNINTIPTLTIKVGTIYSGTAIPDNYCLYGEEYIYVKNLKSIQINRATDIRVRITEYGSTKNYLTQSTYDFIDSLNLRDDTEYVRISAAYDLRGYSATNPVTIDAYQEGDFGIGYISVIPDVAHIKNELDSFNNIISRNIKQDAAVRGTGTRAVSGEILPLSFIHISDIHTKANNYKCFENACEFYEHYSNIKAMIATGDLVWDSYADPMTYYDNALQKTTKPVLNIIGNHDAGQYKSAIGLGSVSTDKQCYDRYIAPYISAGTLSNGVAVPGWGVVQPTDAATNGNSYYYKDFTDEKVRLIVLCEFETEYEINPNDQTSLLYSRELRAMRQAQVTWLINTLTNTPSDYGVIIAMHQPLGSLANVDNEFVSFDLVGGYKFYVYSEDKEWLAKIINAYATKTSLTLSVTQTGAVVQNDAALNCDCDFTNVQSEFICAVCGHTHRDYIGHLTNYPAVKVLCVGADNLLYSSGFQPRAAGTPSEDLFNVVNIDRNRKTIKIIRIGSDASVTGQVRDQMIMSYATT